VHLQGLELAAIDKLASLTELLAVTSCTHLSSKPHWLAPIRRLCQL